MRNVGASIVELDKGRRYRIFAELPRDPITGKRRRLTKVIRGTRKDAERARLELMVRAGEPISGDMTLTAFFDSLFLPDARKRLRPVTVHGYESRFKRFIGDSLGPRNLTEITPLTVTVWLDGIDGDAKKVEAFRVLRLILAKAVRWNLIEANPCARVDPPKKKPYRPEVLTADQARTYLQAFRGTGIEAAVLVAIGAGLRRSEIVGLSWDDVSTDGTVTVDNAVTSVGGVPHNDRPKTRFSERAVHLPPSIMARLEDLRNDGYPLVCGKNGLPMHPDTLTHEYERVRATLPPDVPRVPFKNLRHTSLTLALESGAELLAVSRRAGHSSPAVTSAFYLRPHGSVDRRTADALDGLLKG